MNRILGEVSVKELDGYLEKLIKLLKHKELGHYYLHELGQFLSEAPANVLCQRWLNQLSSHFIWKRAEDHFKKTKQLWYNELAWPFQICVLEIGGLSKEALCKKWLQKYKCFYEESKLTKYIDDLDLTTEKRKIYLIRLQPKYLGFSKETTFAQINREHPQFNLSLCPPETAFFVRPLIKEYSDKGCTVFAANFKPATMADETEKKVFRFDRTRRYISGLYMEDFNISPDDTVEANVYWIFQYNQTYKNTLDDL